MYLQFSLRFLPIYTSTKKSLTKIHSRTEMTIAKIFKSLYEGTLKFFQLLKTTFFTIHISKQKLNCKNNPVVVFGVL